MHTLNVSLGERSYPIYIGENALSADALGLDAERLSKAITGETCLVVTNDTVAPLYLDVVVEQLQNVGYRVDTVILPDGESFKTIETLDRIFSRLLKAKHNRRTTLLALGGGVIGDMTGFAAACYQRGVNFFQVPTTLLAQVDSSVGGKTGVNHALGKNMIGAFYQPKSVLISTDTLRTLPARELAAGLAEVIKYGFIYDENFFAWLEKNIEKLNAKAPDALIYAIKRSCEIKAEVVAQDEMESGIRAILNLGHTFGHAIEAHQGYGSWLHGEAVGCGMAMALDLSARHGWVSQDIYARSIDLIKKAHLPINPPPEMSVEDFLKYMTVDKKNTGARIRLVLLERLGKAVITEEYHYEHLLNTLARKDFSHAPAGSVG